jgi:4-amino-4-deoxy-L-arabinose transferase-like glycosyltransferase
MMLLKNNKGIFILLGLALFVWLAYFRINFGGLTAPDAMHYATIARNIIRGNGMLADDAIVAEVAFLKDNIFRVTRNAPLHPLIMSVFFFIFGISDYSAAFSSAFLYLLSVPIIYLLGKKLFDEKVAWFSSLLFIINPYLLGYSISGLTEPLFIFFILLSFYLLSISFDRKGFFIVGALLGLSRLVKIHAVFFLLPFLCCAWFFKKGQGLKNSFALFFGFIVLSLPEIIRGYMLFGDPIFSGYTNIIYHFKYSSDHLTNSFKIAALPNWWDIVFVNLPVFAKHYVIGLERHCYFFLSSMSFLLMALFIVGIFRWYDNRNRNLFKAVLLFSILIELLALSVSRQPARYFHIFIPLMLIFSMEFMCDLFSKIRFKYGFGRKSAIAILVVFLAYPSGLDFVSALKTQTDPHQRVGFPFIKELLAKYTGADEIIVTDFCGLAWPADRRMVGLPLNYTGLRQVEEKIEVSAILLTNYGQGWMKKYEGTNMSDWHDAYSNPPLGLGKYRFIGIFNDGEQRVVLYKK